jgi:hypothetical protein
MAKYNKTARRGRKYNKTARRGRSQRGGLASWNTVS